MSDRKVRLVTPRQFNEGYYIFAGGLKIKQKYEVAWRDGAGNYGVYEPEMPPEALSSKDGLGGQEGPLPSITQKEAGE